MTHNQIAIVGGGVSGFCAGIYLQRNGFTTTIFEMAPTPGGVTSFWKREGYTFDGGTNWFPGSGPALNFHEIVTEIFDFPSWEILNFEKFMRIRLLDDSYMDIFTCVDDLKKEMLRIAPEDVKTINEFTDAILQASRLKLPIKKARELFTLIDFLKIGATSIPLGLFAIKWQKITIQEYAKRFSNPRLQKMFTYIFPRHSFFSVLGLMMSLGWMHLQSAGYPIGGSKKLLDALMKEYTRLGGVLHCSTKVTKIVVENSAACGVTTEAGKTFPADMVISTADGYSTYCQLLGNTYTTPEKRAFFEKAPVFPSLIQISLGIRGDFSQHVHKTVIEFDPPIASGSDTINVLQVRFCHFDGSLAPSGRTSVIVHLRTHDYNYWVNLRKENRPGYLNRKNEISQQIIALLQQRCGIDPEQIEVVDVATPASYIRYTDSYKGSYQSWAPTPELIGKSLPKTIPGLANFFMCGQWVEPAGGLPRAVLSARNMVQIICAQQKTPFKSR